ncbi:MAG: hypothetical protein MAG794_01035 [Gammaproteobacteria bacterium]|nr:hypothetical protein [Gammaproteobacteria bacterium]
MYHQHVADAVRIRVGVDFDISCPAAACEHLWMQAVSQVDDFLFALQDGGFRLGGMVNTHHLYLADQDRFGALRKEPATVPYDLGGGTQRGDDGRFFHDQRDHVLLVVDDKVQRQSHGQTHHADHVLDHLVRDADVEHVLSPQQGHVIGFVQQSALVYGADALAHGKIIEIRYSRHF